MSEHKKPAKIHGKRVTLYHKNGNQFEFEPIDAKEVLLQKDCEYSKDPAFWDAKKPLEMPPLATLEPPEFKEKTKK